MGVTGVVRSGGAGGVGDLPAVAAGGLADHVQESAAAEAIHRDVVEAPRTAPARGRVMDRDHAVREGAAVLAREGQQGFAIWLRGQPEILARFGRMQDGELRQALGAELGRLRGSGFLGWGIGNGRDAAAAVGEVAERIGHVARERVRQQVVPIVDRHVQAMQAQLRDVRGFCRQLAGARAPSPEWRLAQRIGIYGTNPDDISRAREALSSGLTAMRELRQHMFGQTWEVTDFPRIGGSVVRGMGLTSTNPGAVAHDALTDGARDDMDRAHWGESVAEGLEIGHAIVHVGHAMHTAFEVATVNGASAGTALSATGEAGLATATSTAVAAPVLVAAAGIAFGIAIHHEILENIEGRRALARGMGL